MSEEQIAEKIQAEENKFMIILGAFLGVVWILMGLSISFMEYLILELLFSILDPETKRAKKNG